MAARRQGRYRLAGIEVDPRRRQCLLDGEEVPLAAQEFDLLEYLLRNPHRSISAEELKAGILPTDETGSIPLEQFLERLRNLLETASGGEPLLKQGEDGGTLLDAEVIFAPEIWADSAEVAVEPIPPGYTPYLSDDDDPDVVEGRRKLTADESARLRRMGIGIALVVLAAAGAWAGWRWMHRPQPSGVKAVLSHIPGAGLGASLDTAVRLELEQSPFVALETSEQVSAALHGGKPLPSDLVVSAAEARRACSARGADVYVTGQLRRVGPHDVLTLEARDCGTDQRRARSQAIADDDTGILALLAPVTGDLRRQLGESRASVDRTDRPLTASAQMVVALTSYTQAEQLAAAGQRNPAIAAMQKAADGGLLMAQVALSRLYQQAHQPELAAASLRHAYDERGSLPTDQEFAVKTAYDETVSEDLNAALEDARVWGAAYRMNALPQKAQARIDLQLGHPEAATDPAWKALELNDEDADAYALLAEAQMASGRIDEAAATIRLAITHGLQEDHLHALHYEIGAARNDDQAMQTERQWADGKPEAALLHSLDARREFAAGEVRDAEADATAAADLWRTLGMVGQADRSLAETAATEARLGLTVTATTTVKDLPEMIGNAPLAITWAETGQLEKATAAMQQSLAAHPSSTLWQQVWSPEIAATLALAENKPEAAVDALRKSVGYELRSPDISLLRGQALLAEKQPEMAEMEFRRLLSHPDIDPLSVDLLLAQVGLARALAAEGRQAEAATEFLMLERTTLKSADADLPLLHAIRDEETKLGAAARDAAAKSAVPTGSASAQPTGALPAAPLAAPRMLPKPKQQ